MAAERSGFPTGAEVVAFEGVPPRVAALLAGVVVGVFHGGVAVFQGLFGGMAGVATAAF